MKKYFLIIILFTYLPFISISQDCGFDGEADRSFGISSCMNGCFNGYERCENVFNARYRSKLEMLLWDSAETVCISWLQNIFGFVAPHDVHVSPCDVWSRTADIDGEYYSNLQIAINLLNRCVNTCDGGFR